MRIDIILVSCYNSKAKKSGEVYYYLDSLQKGYGKFKNNKLIEFNHCKDYGRKASVTVNLLNDSLVFEMTSKKYREKYKTKGSLIEKPYCKFFTERAERNLKPTNELELYLEDFNIPLSIIEIRDGLP